MKKKILFGLTFLVALVPLFSFGEVPQIVFEENKNQWPDCVKFKADVPGGRLFLERNTFTYVYENSSGSGDHDLEDFTVNNHCFKVNFENSNPGLQLAGNNLQERVSNYYLGNDPKKWSEHVQFYGQIYYSELYKGIDMQVYHSGQNLKYDLVIHAGANPQNIRLKYTGADGLVLENGHLLIKTSVGNLIEDKPYAYQEVNGTRKEIRCAYVLNGSTLSFRLGDYDPALPLVIDPTLIAATYSNSKPDNRGYTATYDNAGNIYMGGIIWNNAVGQSGNGYPTTVGAYSTTFKGGDVDVTLSKFDPNGTTLLFSTYFGGTLTNAGSSNLADEQPHSIVVNSNNELYVVGRTRSGDFPKTAGAYGAYKAGYDIFVGRFNSSGALLGSSIIGGSGDDCINVDYTIPVNYNNTKYSYGDDGRSEIILDGNSNVYVAACTKSTDFPTTAGAIKTTLGGVQDGVVFKMNSTLSTLSASTYLGGSGYDAAYGLKLDNSNNIYVTGGTTSSDFPTTAGVIHTTFQGGTADGFIAVLNNTCTTLLHSTYIGTNQYDQSFFLELNAGGDVYVYGQTKGAYPVTAGVYSNPNSGQFVHKLTGDLKNTVFSTVIGNGGNNVNLSPTAFLVDSCESIYLSGWGRCKKTTASNQWLYPNPANVKGMPITANAFQKTTDGCDFYFMVLLPDAKSLWYATYYGEANFDSTNAASAGSPDHVDGGTCRFDSRAVIYHAVCASCGGSSGFPTTASAYSRTNGGLDGSKCNEAVIKMDVRVQPVAKANAITATSGCVPLTVKFNNNGSSATDYLWDFGDGSSLDTSSAPSHTYLSVGTYTLTLYAVDSVGACGFIANDTLIIYVGQPPTLQTSVTNISCFGGVGSATVTATGGFNPLTYSWSTSPVQTTPSAVGLAAGSYTVSVKDHLACPATASVTITQPAQPLAATTSVVAASCGGSNGSITATTTGGTPVYTYSWSTTPVQTNSVAIGLPPGSYSVLITDSKGCTTTGSATVGTVSQPTVTVASTNAGCTRSNGTATATPTGGTAPYTFLWSYNNQITQTATGLPVGTYTVQVADNRGCAITETITVSPTPSPSATINSTPAGCTVANGTATVNPSGGTAPYTYSWSTMPVQNTQTAINLAAGIYTVLVTDTMGCATTQTVNITPTAPPALTTSATVASCSKSNGSATVNPSGGTPGYTYLWSPIPGTSQTENGLPGGTYTVQVTDANGCASTATVSVPSTSQPSISITSTPAKCSVSNGSATANITGGTPGFTFAWSPGAGNTQTISNLAGGNYTVVVTDANGCSNTDSAKVTATTKPSITMASTTAKCSVANGTATANPSNGTAPYTYSWNTTPAQTTPTAVNLAGGNYTVTITDANGCTNTATVSVNATSQPAVTVATTTASCSAANGTATANPTGGVPPYTYLWMPINKTTKTVGGLPGGSYSVTVTDSNGCSRTVPVTIPSTASPTATVTSKAVKCFGQKTGSATVQVTGGVQAYSYLWNNTSPVQVTSTANGLAAGTYTVKVTDANGCTTTNTVLVTQPASALTAKGGPSGVSCINSAMGTATVTATGGTGPYNYYWSTGGQTSSSATHLAVGNSSVTITDANGCKDTVVIAVPAGPQPVAAFTRDSAVSCHGLVYVFKDSSSKSTSVFWNLGDGTTSTDHTVQHVYSNIGTYTVTMVAANTPCKDTAFATVVAGDLNLLVKIGAANVFTPNGDGVNDCFHPALIGPGADTLIECMTLEVFDRWGIKMFESNDGVCWDGDYHKNGKPGVPAVDGTYYYIATVGHTKLKGYVTLLRRKN